MAAGALALGGCAYGDLGYGSATAAVTAAYGYGYGGYYGGYGYGGGYGGYGYGGYGITDTPHYGWYDDYYYPGSGIYVYDSYRRRHVWNTASGTTGPSRQRTGDHSGTEGDSTSEHQLERLQAPASSDRSTAASPDAGPPRHQHRRSLRRRSAGRRRISTIEVKVITGSPS